MNAVLAGLICRRFPDLRTAFGRYLLSSSLFLLFLGYGVGPERGPARKIRVQNPIRCKRCQTVPGFGRALPSLRFIRDYVQHAGPLYAFTKKKENDVCHLPLGTVTVQLPWIFLSVALCLHESSAFLTLHAHFSIQVER